jgi:hypothetical protein
LECVDNVPFRGNSSHFHKTKLKGNKLFGLGLGPTLFHVQNNIILRLLCLILEWNPKSFTKQNNKNQRAIEFNFWLWGFSFTLKGNNVKIENNYKKKDEAENNQQWGEDFAIPNLLHIGKIVQYLASKDLPTYKPKNDQHYYVNMFQSPIMKVQ